MPTLSIDSQPNDDSDFLDIVSRLITGAAIANGLRDLWVVHIDHWFGERWLGFHGKLLGIAGVRNRSLTDELIVPPFHPNRVQSIHRFAMTDNHGFESQDVGWRRLHGYRTSQDNLRHVIRITGVYVWYSGNTTETSNGVVMIYVVRDSRYAAWYTMFHKDPSWRLTRNVGIAARKVREFIPLAPPRNP